MDNRRKIIQKQNKANEIEVILNPKDAIKGDEKESIIREMERITIQAWEDFGDTVHKWFNLADILLIAKDNERIISFSTAKFENESLIIFLATMVHPSYQGLGLNKVFQNIIFKEFFKKKKKIVGFKAWKYLSNLYFSFRTANPRLVKEASKLHIALPIYGYRANYKEIEIARTVREMFSKEYQFDEKNFVIKGALRNKPNLIYTEDHVPWSHNKMIDEFCRQHLRYKEKEGNLFIIVGHLNFIQQLGMLIRSKIS